MCGWPGRGASGTKRQDLYAVPQGLRNGENRCGLCAGQDGQPDSGKSRIMEYLQHKPLITNQKAQELCGLNKNQTYYKLSAKMYSVRRTKTSLRMFSASFSVKM